MAAMSSTLTIVAIIVMGYGALWAIPEAAEAHSSFLRAMEEEEEESEEQEVAAGFGRAALAAATAVPDWVYAFGEGPRVNVTLSFHTSNSSANNVSTVPRLGQLLPRNATQMRPRVSFNVSAKSASSPNSSDSSTLLLALLVVDPDARSPDNPIVRNYLHWIVSNIAFSPSSPSSREIWELGVENVPYVGPAPPLGIHRYYALVFLQEGYINVSTIRNRTSFSVRNFTRTYNLYYPIGGTFFEASAIE